MATMNVAAGPSPASDVRRLETAMEAGNLAWWEMDCGTGAVSFHRRKTDMLGYEPEGFTHYTHFTALLHPDDVEPAMQAMRDHLSGTRPEYRIDYRIQAKTGAYRWFEDVGRISQRDEAGRPAVVTGIVLDITDRKRAEAALSASEERFRGMFHGHSAVKLIIDPETGDVADANEAAARFYGWSAGELRRMRIQQINELPPDAVKDRMASAAAAPNTRFEFRHRRADGSVRDVEVYSNRVVIAGRPYLYSIIHDIDDRKRAEEALRAAHDRLRHAEDFARFGHWEFSLDDLIMHASEGALQVYGFTEAEIPLSAIKECALVAYRPRLDSALRNLLERNAPYAEEFEIRRVSDGEIVHVHSKAEYDARTRKVFGVVQDITQRKRIEAEREALIQELQRAIEQVKTLKGIVPICANCKKIRDDRGFWEQVEAYVSKHTDAEFSHGICPDCMERLYPGV
jgi:PAS domain S-box-containing protein